MSRHISDERLEELTGKLRIMRHYEGFARDFTIDCRELSCIVDELRKRRSPGKKGIPYGKNTRAMMAMEVGQTIILPPTTQSALTTSRNSARKALGAPDARWHCVEQPGGHILCTRKPDGSPHEYGKPKNPGVAQLAAMRLHDIVVIKGHVSNRMKIQAKVQMGLAAVKWQCRVQPDGDTRVTRVT